jgi:hypothetical protein
VIFFPIRGFLICLLPEVYHWSIFNVVHTFSTTFVTFSLVSLLLVACSVETCSIVICRLWLSAIKPSVEFHKNSGREMFTKYVKQTWVLWRSSRWHSWVNKCLTVQSAFRYRLE